MLSCVFALFSVFGLARASAAPPRDTFTTLSATQVHSFKPYTLYAAAAFCPPSQTQSWSCGWGSFYKAFVRAQSELILFDIYLLGEQTT
jgi:hypothetical protein